MARQPSISRLIELFPDDQETLIAAGDRIARLSRACGCAEGGIAVLVATGLVAVYWLWPGCCASNAHRVRLVWAVPFVLVAAGVGKLAGIAVAKLRLRLIYRRLSTKYQRLERHVHMHEVGRSGGHRV